MRFFDPKQTLASAHPLVTIINCNTGAEFNWGKNHTDSHFIDISDEWWSIAGGELQEELHRTQTASHVTINFERVEWIDPIAILGLFVSVKSFCKRTKSSVRLVIGESITSHKKRNGFIGFVAQHGFVDAFSDIESASVVLNNSVHDIEPGSTLLDNLSGDEFSLTYPESRCLKARIISASIFGGETDKKITQELKLWLAEIKDYGLSRFYEGEDEVVEDILHKIRVLLTEILHNAAEHAYRDDDNKGNKYFGIYIRTRQQGIGSANSEALISAIKRENLKCPTLSQFDRHINDSWLEVFYVDEGKGLLADLDIWKLNAVGALREKLNKIKPSTNALSYLCRLFFQEPISRYKRIEKTALTGMQHIRLILSDGEDFSRTYTAGEWFGNTHPWKQKTLNSFVSIKKQSKMADYRPVGGTSWHYCIKLHKHKTTLSDSRFDNWVRISDTLLQPGPVDEVNLDKWSIIDERDLGGGIDYINWAKLDLRHDRNLWLPGAVTKQHVYGWLKELHKQCNESPSGEYIWLIADLSREQAHTLSKVLLSERITLRNNAKFNIYIITSDWLFIYLKRNPFDQRMYREPSAKQKSAAKKLVRPILDLLRTNDSRLFWGSLISESTPPIGDALIREPVIWKRDCNDRPVIVLNGYLDLTHALSDPLRASVSAKALRRIWFLYAYGAECVASDALLSNLLPREARLELSYEATEENKIKNTVVVSSILVTGGTAEQASETGHKAIHLLRHSQFCSGEDLISSEVKLSDRYALNWLSSRLSTRPVGNGELDYERIPGTPYIGRGGAKAIPVRRFYHPTNELDHFTKSIYEETPQETYEHFISLGLLKIGHWVYGPHHDLLTINLGLAIERESLNQGRIVEWLCEKLKEFCSEGANLVVYPSHHVTEKIIQVIRRNITSGISEGLPKYYLPIHFIGTHTQTAIRIPSLTYDRIRDYLSSPGLKNKLVILLDDGTLTGKVHREVEELLRNAGAKEVAHIGLVTRTGLPLYRKYLLGDFAKSHKYFWRWDVPPLGNARTCPLCRALEQAIELSSSIWSYDAKYSILKWIEQWSSQSVSTHWWRHGTAPAVLPESRTITFGKEWPKDGRLPLEYQLNHLTSTGLAATVCELIRITSYKGVGLKISKEPWNKSTSPDNYPHWRRCKLEILLSQTLLFYDDFNEHELVNRYKLVLETLIEERINEDDRPIDYLACLVMLLPSNANSSQILRHILPIIGRHSNIPIDALIVIGLLARKINLTLARAREEFFKVLPKQEQIIAELNYFTSYSHAHAYKHGHSELRRGTRHGLMMSLVLLGENNTSSHTGFLRRKLIGDIYSSVPDILRDLNLLSQALQDIDPLILEGPADSGVDLSEESESIRGLMDIGTFPDASRIDQFARPIHSKIFGHETCLANKFRSAFIAPVSIVQAFITTGITQATWNALVLSKRATPQAEKWIRSPKGGPEYILLPNIMATVEPDIPLDAALVFPPIAKQLLLDFMLNVFHACDRYLIGDSYYDMKCHISQVDNEAIKLELRNKSFEDSGLPRIKASEPIVASQLLIDPVTRCYSLIDGEVVITVRLPLVSGLEKE